jgi:hypothetical protein
MVEREEEARQRADEVQLERRRAPPRQDAKLCRDAVAVDGARREPIEAGHQTPTAVPITLYDPELMSEWIEDLWSKTGGGKASTLGAEFTARTEGAAHELTANTTCKQPPTTPFDQDNDDLFQNAE